MPHPSNSQTPQNDSETSYTPEDYFRAVEERFKKEYGDSISFVRVDNPSLVSRDTTRTTVVVPLNKTPPSSPDDSKPK